MELGINKLPWYAQVILFVVLSAAGIYLFETYYAAEQEKTLATQRAELTAIRGRITKGMAIARRLPEFQAQVRDLEVRLESLKAVLPDQRDVGEMLRRIQTLASQSNLVVKKFQPKAVENREMHAEWPMLLEFDGTYHDMGRFFDRVSKVPRIINISGIHINARKPEDSAQDGATISAECTATTFVLLDKPQTADAAAGKKGGAGKPASNAAAAR